MLRIFASLLLVLMTLVLPAHAAKRVALVIGNGAYAQVTPLVNPLNDAALMTTSLQQAGFEVVTLTNLDQRAMKKAMLDFGRILRGGVDASLFYYAGHGVQVAVKITLCRLMRICRARMKLTCKPLPSTAFWPPWNRRVRK